MLAVHRREPEEGGEVKVGGEDEAEVEEQLKEEEEDIHPQLPGERRIMRDLNDTNRLGL